MSAKFWIWLFPIMFVLSLPLHAQEPELEEDDESVEAEFSNDVTDATDVPTTTGEYKEPVRAERKKICDCYFAPDVPYRDRRSSFGGFVGVQAGTYTPDYYQPDFSVDSYETYYGTPTSPEVELVFGAKWNAPLMSVGVQLSGGFFSAKKDSTNAELTIQPITGGIIGVLDGILPEPYIAPYGIIGMYSVIYREKAGGLSVSGNTSPAVFYAAGALFQLNWMDRDSANDGYQDYGLENTYLFAEARQFMQGSGNEPDFSTDIHYNGGLRIEF